MTWGPSDHPIPWPPASPDRAASYHLRAAHHLARPEPEAGCAVTVALSPASRDARIYRVNAWRDMKGRPALTFQPLELTPGGPEWWTEANTRAWHNQVWRGDITASEAQRGWGGKHTEAVGRAGAGCYTPLKAKTMAEWRLTDPRPSPATYYDGRTIDYAAARAYSAAITKPSPRKRGAK
jgi:hypothetical protein